MNALGKTVVMSVEEALSYIEGAVCEGVTRPTGSNVFGRPHVHVSSFESAMGMVSAGLRAQSSADGCPAEECARRHLPLVASSRDFLTSDGWFQTAATDVQDVVDLTLLCHRLSETALAPSLVRFPDFQFRQSVALPDEKSLRQFVGAPDDAIESPTPSQRLLFGKQRRRIPNWFHMDLPVLFGMRRSGREKTFETASSRTFYDVHHVELLDSCRSVYRSTFDRSIEVLQSYRADDADELIITYGPAFHAAAAVVQRLRGERRKVGAVALRLLRPLPIPTILRMLSGKSGVTILEPIDSALSLFADVQIALEQAVRARKNGDTTGLSEKQIPMLYSVRAAKGAPGEIVRAFENMRSTRRRFVFTGFDYTRSKSSFPKREALLQTIRQNYPDAEPTALGVSEFELAQTIAIRCSGGAPDVLCGYMARRWSVRVASDNHDIVLTREAWPYALHLDKLDILVTPQPSARDARLMRHGGIVILTSDCATCDEAALRALVDRGVHFVRLAAVSSETLVGVLLQLLSRQLEDSQDPSKEFESFHKYWIDQIGRSATEDQQKAIRAGLSQALTEVSLTASASDELPMAVRRYADQGPPYTRVSGHYDRVGYFDNHGLNEEIVADPFFAIPVAPHCGVHTAAADPLPVLAAQACSGCGECSVYCPEAAISTVAQSVESILQSAVERIRANGSALSQLTPPVYKSLARLMQKSLSTQPATTLRDILPGAVDQLLTQSKPSNEALLRNEILLLEDKIGDLPIVATETFFRRPEQQSKGSGLIFSLVIQPASCTGCGICVDACPEGALSMAVGAAPVAIRRRQIWEDLPDTPGDLVRRLVDDESYNPLAALLLSRHYAMAFAGGLRDTGRGVVWHLATAIAEAAAQSSVVKAVQNIDEQVRTLTEKVQTKLRDALPGNIDDLLSALVDQEQTRTPFDKVISRIAEQKRIGVLETGWIERVGRLVSDLRKLSKLLIEGPSGLGRSRFGAVVTSDDLCHQTLAATTIVYSGAASLDYVRGLCEGHVRQMIDNAKLLRRAEWECKGQYEPALHDAVIASLRWSDLTDDEKSLVPPVLVMADASLFAKNDTHRLADLLSAGYPIKIVVVDPAVAPSIQLPLAMFGMRNVYYLQSSPSDPRHLFRGLLEGLHRPGPACFRILAPAESRAMTYPEVFELALASRAFPLVRYHPSAERSFLSAALDLNGNPPDNEKTFADWMVHQRPSGFEPLSETHRNPTALHEYMNLDAGARVERTPVIQCGSRSYVVPPHAVEASEDARAAWNRLREIAGQLTPHPLQLKQALEAEWNRKQEDVIANLRSEYEERLHKQADEQTQLLRQRLRDRLVQLSGFARGNS